MQMNHLNLKQAIERKFEESIKEQKERLTRFLPSPILF